MLPNDLHALVRRLHLKVRKKMQASLLGNYHSLFRGSGLTFEEVREYQPGDDIRTIDWNVTARLNAPFVKRYSEERQRTILLMIDISGSLDFSSEANGKRQVLAELAALIALSAIGNQDRVGLLLFAGGIELYLPPGKAKMNVPRLLREILLANHIDPRTDLKGTLEFVNKLPLRKAIIFLMSDFQSAGYESNLRRTAAKHEVLAVRVTDPRERDIPAVGLVRLRDAETGMATLIDSSSKRFRSAFSRKAVERKEQFTRTMIGARVDALEVTTAGSHLDDLIRFFERRASR